MTSAATDTRYSDGQRLAAVAMEPNAAIDILETLDEPQQAYTLTEAELNTATTPYYYMLHLASIDEKLGRTDAALGWMNGICSKASETRRENDACRDFLTT